MKMEDYINEIKLELTGSGVLELELTDEVLEKVVKKALRELQRYIDTTFIVTRKYEKCIDLSTFNPPVSSVSSVFRTTGTIDASAETQGGQIIDPIQASQWQLLTNGAGSTYSMSSWIMNFSSWNTMLQIRNTMSTDLSFKQDMQNKKLYINCSNDYPSDITIEYVPEYFDVEMIKSDYWIDVLVRLSVALTKVTLGRIRTRYTQSNALWTQDGETLLEEGNNELTDLREKLRVNSQVIYPID